MDKPNLNETATEQLSDAVNDNKHGANTESTPQEDTQLTGLPLYALLFSMLLLIFVITLDISILATAVPRITDEFKTIRDIGWYGSAFMIGQCGLQPLSGRIYSIFPFKISFITFFTVFELGSLLCGIAQSSKMLIVGRAICGIGSAGLMNGALIIIGLAAPPGKRASMMGIFMSVSSCGQVIGPLIGGALTQHVTWRWCFYMNLPIGGFAILGFLFTRLPDARDGKTDFTFKSIVMSLDLPGFVQFAPACVMLLLGLEWGGNVYPWRSSTVIGLLCGSGVLFVVFTFWERWQGDRAMIPRSVLGVRAVFSSCITAMLQGGSMLILVYWLPVWFQVIKGASPTRSAVYTLPNFVSQVLMSLVAGAVVNKIGYVLPFMLLGSILNTTSYGLLSTFRVTASAGHYIGYQVIAGLGRGMSLQMPILAVQAAVPKPKIATVSAMVMWSQFFGGAIFLSLAQTVFVHLLRSALHEYTPSIDPAVVIEVGATAYTTVVPKELYHGVELAYNKAIAHTFYLGVAVAALSFLTSFGVGGLKADMKLMTSSTKETSENGTGEDLVPQKELPGKAEA